MQDYQPAKQTNMEETMTHQQAYDTLPPGAQWSSSFGDCLTETFVQIWRCPDGRRFEIRRANVGGGFTVEEIKR